MLLLFQQDFSNTDTIIVEHNLNQEFDVRIIDDVNIINNNLVDRIEFDVVDPYNKVVVYLKEAATGRVQLLSTESVIVTTRDKIKIDEIGTIDSRTTNNMSTGILTGGEISINGEDNTKFDVAAGVGVIVDNYTDPLNPVITNVEWTIKTAQIDSYLATTDETSVAIDIDGNIYLSGYYFTDEERRDLIVLGNLGHLGRTEIEYVIVEPSPVFDVKVQLDDFLENFGAFNISGNVFGPNGSNLYIDKTEGKVFDGGVNYINSKKSPNIYMSDVFTAPYVQYYYRDSGGSWVSGDYTQSINPDEYDSGFGLVDVPSGKFTIQTLFLYVPTDTVDILFGQATYDSIVSAESSIFEFIELNPFLEYDVFRGWLIVKQGAVDLSDSSKAKFIKTQTKGMFVDAAGFGSGTGKTQGKNIGTGGVGLYDGKEEITLRFRNINSGSNKISVTLDDINKEVDLDVIEGYLFHQSIFGAGTNTHAQIDSHIGSTSNPHRKNFLGQHMKNKQFIMINMDLCHFARVELYFLMGIFILKIFPRHIFHYLLVDMQD